MLTLGLDREALAFNRCSQLGVGDLNSLDGIGKFDSRSKSCALDGLRLVNLSMGSPLRNSRFAFRSVGGASAVKSKTVSVSAVGSSFGVDIVDTCDSAPRRRSFSVLRGGWSTLTPICFLQASAASSDEMLTDETSSLRVNPFVWS